MKWVTRDFVHLDRVASPWLIQRFVDATAVIRNGAVEVSSPAVPAPVAVRYAWANAPEATLVNGEGLPSFPFRSDDWPVTADK